jgi:hypothetical protein
MFKNKRVKPIEKQVVVEPRVSNPSIHMVDVNMAITKSRLLKNRCTRTKNQLKRSLLLTRKRSIDYNNLLSRLQEMQVEDPPKILFPKEKT